MALIERNKKFDVPFVYLMQRIDKEMRTKLFKSIVNGYYNTFKNAKKVLAYLNWDIQIQYDYLFIMETKNDVGMDFYLIDLVPFAARRSIPGYRYCVIKDLTKEFFEDGFAGMIPIDKKTFETMITQTLGLSLNKNAENYWKKAENMKPLIEHMSDFVRIYKPQIII